MLTTYRLCHTELLANQLLLAGFKNITTGVCQHRNVATDFKNSIQQIQTDLSGCRFERWLFNVGVIVHRQGFKLTTSQYVPSSHHFARMVNSPFNPVVGECFLLKIQILGRHSEAHFSWLSPKSLASKTFPLC